MVSGMRLPSDAVFAYLCGAMIGGALGWSQTIISADAVVAAAAMAGIGDYCPSYNIQCISYSSQFSLINTVIILLFNIGFGIVLILKAVYAIQGAIYASAVSLLVFSISGRLPFAVMAGVFFEVVIPFSGGVKYTDYIIATHDQWTYGIIGLGLVLTAAAYLAAGWFSAAALAPGLIILCHPVLGVWSMGLGFFALLAGRRDLGEAEWRRLLSMGGWSALAALAVVAGALVTGRPPAPSAVDMEWQRVFIDLWDYHRNAELFPSRMVAVGQAVALGGLAWAWLVLERARHSAATRGLATYVVVSAVVSVPLYAAFHALRDHLPLALLIEMPNRFVNIPVALTFAVLCGLALRSWGNPLAWVILAVLFGLPLADSSLGLGAWHPAVAILLCAAVLGLWWRPFGRVAVTLERFGLPLPLPFRGAWAALTLAVSAAVALWIVWTASPLLAESVPARTVQEKLRDLPGPVLFGDLMSKRIMTAVRPGTSAFLDLDSMDFIVRLPHLAARWADILETLYGVEARTPPSHSYRTATLYLDVQPFDSGSVTATRRLWEGWSTEEWRELAVKYGFGSVVAPSRWQIRLPVVMTLTLFGGVLAIYRVPDVELTETGVYAMRR